MSIKSITKKPKTILVEENDNVFAEELRTGNFFNRNLFVILAFVIPFLLMSTAFAIMKCEPFGDKQILVTDLWHQYYPFLVDLQDKLKNGESLFWSWTQGGGTNYFALMSYYLASPLKFLSVFIPVDWLRMFLTFTVSFKIGLAGCFCAIFLRYVYKKDNLSITIFSTCFALSSFFMGYYWCEIWLDTAALLPLVTTGFVALMREGKFKLYTITLALSILANYYIGLFTCVFIFLCFVGYNICMWDNLKGFGKRFLRIASFTLIGLSLTAILILPAFFGLQNTHATSSTFPTGYAINIGETNDLKGTLDAIRQVLSNTITYVEPTTTEGLPNVACGTVSIVLGIMFFCVKGIKIREKIFSGCLLLFFALSFIIRQLDYMWHGFHFTNMIPYRFSFLFSFVLVVMAFRAFILIKRANTFDFLICGLLVTVLLVFCVEIQSFICIFATAITAGVIVYIVALLHRSKSVNGKNIMSALLLIVVAIEGGVTAYMGVKTTSVTSTTDYPRGGENTAEVVEYMKNSEQDTTELWRAEFTSTQTLCDSSLNCFNGISMFNSMTNRDFTIFAQNFGMMGWRSGNRYTYAESSPVTNLFMNLKYIIARDGNYNNKQYLKEVHSEGSVVLTENTSYIPMGFMTNSELINYNGIDDEDSYNPFEKQNQFFSLATGIEESVYTPLQVVSQGHSDPQEKPVTKSEYGKYSYNGNTNLKWNYTAPADGYYYVYADIDGASGSNVMIMRNDSYRDGTYKFYIKRPYIMSVGYFDKGDKISVYAALDANSVGNATVYVNYFNQDVYEEGYEILSESVMTTTKLTGNKMEGTINVKEDGLFYTSVPFEDGLEENDTLMSKLFACESEGWNAYVDGEKVEITPIANALVAFELEAGEHTIELKYLPKGFIKGAILTTVGLLAFVGIIVLDVKRKKRNLMTEALEEESNEKTDDLQPLEQEISNLQKSSVNN